MPSDQDESPEDTLPVVRDWQDLSEFLARLGITHRANENALLRGTGRNQVLMVAGAPFRTLKVVFELAA